MSKKDTDKRNKLSTFFSVCVKYYQAIWFVILLVVFSVFVFCEFKPQISFSALNAQNIIFSAWIVLLFIPLIKSIDIAGIIKLITREDKKALEELREAKNSITVSVNTSSIHPSPEFGATGASLGTYNAELQEGGEESVL